MHSIFKYLILFCAFTFISVAICAKNKKNKTPKPSINWLTIEEVEQKMTTEPKLVYVDIYTTWCGPCRLMDKKTFRHPKVIEYINKHFYAIHLNAEQKESIVFKGETYTTRSDIKINYLALDWMLGRPSYPTSVFLNEKFEEPKPAPGYLDVPTMEIVLHYFKENHYKTTPFETFRANYKTTWK